MDNSAKIEAEIKAGIGKRAKADADAKRSARDQKAKKPRTSAIAKSRNSARAAGKKATQRGGRGVAIKVNKNGKDASGACGYLQKQDKKHELISSNCDDLKSFERTANELAKKRPELKNIGHISISFPADTNFDHSKWAEMVDEVRQNLGLDDTFPFVAVRHFDTEHPHAHLVFSRISITGKVHDQGNLGLRAASCEQVIEQKYNLNLHEMKAQDQKAPTKGELEMMLRTGELSTRAGLQAICSEAMENCDNVVTYFSRLKDAGVDVEITTQNEGARITGIVYHQNQKAMKASDLGKKFTALGLQKQGVVYEQNEHGRAIETIQNESAITRFSNGGGDLKNGELPIVGRNGGDLKAAGDSDVPAISNPATSRADAGDSDVRSGYLPKTIERNRGSVQRKTEPELDQNPTNLGVRNDNFESASNFISDLADASANNQVKTGHSSSSRFDNSAPTNPNHIAQLAQIKSFGNIPLQLSIMLPMVVETGKRPMLKRDFEGAQGFEQFRAFALAKNAQGAEIYIAPHPSANHSFVLIDDLTFDSIQSLKNDGLDPAVVVESSPNNFQAWIKLSEKPLTPAQRLEASRALTKQFGGDIGAIGSVRIGRLAGFTNRKQKHRNEQGLQPYCKLTETSAGVASNGHLVIAKADEIITNNEASKVQIQRLESIESARDFASYNESPADFYQIQAKKILKKYGNQTDYSRLDFMVSTTMIERGFSDLKIAEAMREASPSLAERKTDIEDYIARTIIAAAAKEREKRLEYQLQNQPQHKNEEMQPK
ncbi:MAG: relaxase/mobilization nuclease domain-containing protein [Methylotenera sp.]|nr:relaxase/mobilization nuclease domain-containing protein [Methylotenera sp.]